MQILKIKTTNIHFFCNNYFLLLTKKNSICIQFVDSKFLPVFVLDLIQCEILFSSSLEDGDCGRIVHLQVKTSSGEEILQPVGMYVSKIDVPLTKRTEPHYQAVILSQAFQDLQDSYPYHIDKIRKFRLQEI